MKEHSAGVFFGLVPITILSTDAGRNVSRSAKDVVGNLEMYLFILQTYDMSLMVNIPAAKQCASKAVSGSVRIVEFLEQFYHLIIWLSGVLPH